MSQKKGNVKEKVKVLVLNSVSADILNKKITVTKGIMEKAHILSSREAMLFNMYLNRYPSFEVVVVENMYC